MTSGRKEVSSVAASLLQLRSACAAAEDQSAIEEQSCLAVEQMGPDAFSLKAARDTMVPLELAQHAQMVYAKA